MSRFGTIDPRVLDDSPVPDGRGNVSGGTVVGLTTTEGVLLVADGRTRRGNSIRSESVRKIAAIHPTAAIGSTDDLGEVRSIVRSLRSEVDRYGNRRGEPMAIPALATMASEELRSDSGSTPTFVLGGVDEEGSHVFAVDPDAGAIEDSYVAVGSGRELAYGILDSRPKESLTMAAARRIAREVLESAGERDALTGTKAFVAEITEAGVEVEEYDAVEKLD
jgi:proteasome beta subunit